MNRLELFKSNPILNQIDGFCESLMKAEEDFGAQVKNDFVFSRKEYDVFGLKIFWLGKIGDWYFVGSKNEKGVNEFKFFRNKKMIQIYLTREFEGLEKEEKGFWMHEVEKF